MGRLLDKTRKGLRTVGSFIGTGSPIAAECMAVAGLDYFIFDMEHSPYGLDEAVACIRASESSGISPLVRIPEITRENILKALDAGADGIVIPAVRTLEEAERIVEYGKYYPQGNRGYCPTRANGFGFSDAMSEGILPYAARCNKETMLIPQCETLECLSDIDRISALDGIDGIFIGPFDLSLAMGIPGEFTKREFTDAIEHIRRTVQGNGKPVFIFCPDTESAILRAEQGYDSLTVSLDTGMLINSYKRLLSDLEGKL